MSKVVYAIGDIHGCFTLLVDLQARIAEDVKVRRYTDVTVVYLGDYVDRGPQTREVIERLASLHMISQGFNEVFLKGNHEEAMLEALFDPKVYPTWWWSIGGHAVLTSYGIPTDFDDQETEIVAKVEKLKEVMPLEHMKFLLHCLDHTHRETVGGREFFFCHAGVRPGVALDQQEADDLLWIRKGFLDSDADHGAIIVHGHTITKMPAILPNRIGVDTGAYKHKKLTAVALDDTGTTRFIYAFE